jgi:hypothetical protein
MLMMRTLRAVLISCGSQSLGQQTSRCQGQTAESAPTARLSGDFERCPVTSNGCDASPRSACPGRSLSTSVCRRHVRRALPSRPEKTQVRTSFQLASQGSSGNLPCRKTMSTS